MIPTSGSTPVGIAQRVSRAIYRRFAAVDHPGWAAEPDLPQSAADQTGSRRT